MAELVTPLAIVFVTGGVFLLIANRFSLPAIPFYILAGLLSGTLIAEGALIDLARWGIAFLVFVFGFRTDLSSLLAVVRDSEVAAITQIVVVGPLAFAIALGLGLEPRNALYFAIAATLSSTIVGVGLLAGSANATLIHGRLASSIHFFDDILAVGLVLVLSTDVLTVDAVTSQIGFGVIFVGVGLVFYRHGFPWLVRLADGSDELILMGTISLLIGFLAMAELAGVSIVVGAFAAGLAIRRDHAESIDIINGMLSIRDFFAAIFFVTIGALVSVPSRAVLLLAISLIVLVVVVNPVVTALAFTFEGHDLRTAFLASTSINQISELSLIIAIEALLIGVIAETLFDAIILAAAATMIVASLARERQDAIYRVISDLVPMWERTGRIDERSHVTEGIRDHVVIVGYGRQGRSVARECEANDTPFVVIENDPVVWDAIESECEQYVLGDAVSPYTWNLAQYEEAVIVISTVDHPPVSAFILDLPQGPDVILRSRDAREACTWIEQGALFVAVPDLLASEQLVENIQAVLDDRRLSRPLRERHLEEFVEFERMGFGDRLPR